MSDPRVQGPLSAIGVPIAESIAEHQRLPPYEKNVARATLGAGLLTWCGYLAAAFGDGARQFSDVVLWVWAGCALLGLLWLAVGLRNARGPREMMAAFWSGAVVAVCGWLLWHEAYPSGWGPLGAFILKGCYLAMLTSCAVRFWLAVRGMPGDARKIVRQQIEENRVVWRSARRRR